MKIILLSGGAGKRLFPLSRENYPKQFIPFFNDKSLIQLTLERFYPNFDPNNEIYVLTNKNSLSFILNLKKKSRVPFKTIFEPFSKNTAVSISFSLQFLNDDDIVGVFPVDHLINDINLFNNNLKKALNLAKDSIVLLGIEPLKPDTRFGYIEYFNNDVISFKEKPEIDTAKKYIQSGNFLWNSGIFIFNKKLMEEEIRLFQPEIYNISKKIKQEIYNKKGAIKFDKNDFFYPKKDIEKLYNNYPSISLDYAIIEKTKKLKVIKGKFDWDDLGNFDALAKRLPSSIFFDFGINDKQNNIKKDFKDNQLFTNLSINEENKNIENNTVIGLENKSYGIIGFQDCMLIDTEDVLLLLKKGESDKINQFYKWIESKDSSNSIINNQILKYHKSVLKPWGYYKNIFEDNRNFKIKLIKIEKGEQLSLQKHEHRQEHWVIVEGRGIVIIGSSRFKAKKGKQFFIPSKTLHQAIASKNDDLLIVEVQLGEILSEEDIVRVKDKYKR